MMIVSIAAAVSIDGKLTRHDETNPTAWTSSEDKEHFSALIREHDALVMGRGTYEAVKPRTEPNKLRIVLTSKVEKFKDVTVPGQLEFIHESPIETIKHLADRGYKKVLIVGGPGIISPLLNSGLIDYLYLTIEPYIFGEGKPWAVSELSSELELIGHKQLNERGTLLMTYKVLKTDETAA